MTGWRALALARALARRLPAAPIVAVLRVVRHAPLSVPARAAIVRTIMRGLWWVTRGTEPAALRCVTPGGVLAALDATLAGRAARRRRAPGGGGLDPTPGSGVESPVLPWKPPDFSTLRAHGSSAAGGKAPEGLVGDGQRASADGVSTGERSGSEGSREPGTGPAEEAARGAGWTPAIAELGRRARDGDGVRLTIPRRRARRG